MTMVKNDLLTIVEIQELTGAKSPSKQIEVLRKNKINHIVRLDGSVRVCWHHVHHPNVNKTDELDIDWDAA
ncbi:DUF4224 domain-containing protein [Glaciecola sp. KUL10]|uniref:DUF4224 domain-containing protein n=1 Tax=Glaciecola sp. (strain KUL10) TaxID=2161813 RepID=UPI000D78B200|nr:DUF4224 domain-containing protein [Glaciecola sp. KUL10]GBL02963.1 hypothetical protein KUL10_02360 [Glaciecola sp. KUL10]